MSHVRGERSVWVSALSAELRAWVRGIRVLERDAGSGLWAPWTQNQMNDRSSQSLSTVMKEDALSLWEMPLDSGTPHPRHRHRHRHRLHKTSSIIPPSDSGRVHTITKHEQSLSTSSVSSSLKLPVVSIKQDFCLNLALIIIVACDAVSAST